jgi:hypothetical protein
VPDADREAAWPAVPSDMVEPKSSPVASRPPAPPLSFAPPPDAGEQTARHAVAPAAPAPEVDMARDDASVPPVDVDGGFFDEAHAHGTAVDPFLEVDARDPRMAIKRTAAAARRRAHLAKYVTGTMGVASALLIAALVKGAVASGHETKAPYVSPMQTVAAAFVAMNPSPTPAPAPSPPAPVDSSAPADSARAAGGVPPTDPAQAAQAQPVPAPIEAPVVADPAHVAPKPVAEGPAAIQDPPAPSPSPAQPTAAPAQPTAAMAKAPAAPVPAAGTAVQEKERSRGALERGSVGDAIGSGERAVALDPGDAEAWLILGAAYQQRGDAKNATRCFKACVDQGKRGPKSECAAMLH